MRAPVAVLGMMLFGAAAIPVAAGDRCPTEREAVIARIMAIAEVDLQLRQAELGLIGSSLASRRQALVADARVAEAVPVGAVAPPAPAPAPAPSRARDAAPAAPSEVVSRP